MLRRCAEGIREAPAVSRGEANRVPEADGASRMAVSDEASRSRLGAVRYGRSDLHRILISTADRLRGDDIVGDDTIA